MGLFDFFRSRREREGALPDGTQMSIGEPAKVDDLGQLDDLGDLIKQAAAQGNLNVEVNRESPQVMNLQGQGDELRNAILETLHQHGLDARKGESVNVTDPNLQQAIFQTLAQHGVDVSQIEGGGAIGPSSQLSQGGDSIGQLERLQKLREEGALTEAEFEEQKKRILGG